MQELDPICEVAVKRSFSGEAMQRATLRLGGRVLVLLLPLLFLLTAVYALYLFSFLLAGVALTLFPNAALALALYCAVLAVAVIALLLPLWAGRIRMAGLVAAGRECALSALFYYFCSPRLWWRGVCVTLLALLSLLFPPCFGAAALYAGKETLSLCGALREAREGTRGKLLRVLGFYGRVCLHLLLSVLTLGVLWVLYYAHHSAVAYFEMTMTMDPKGDLQ